MSSSKQINFGKGILQVVKMRQPPISINKTALKFIADAISSLNERLIAECHRISGSRKRNAPMEVNVAFDAVNEIFLGEMKTHAIVEGNRNLCFYNAGILEYKHAQKQSILQDKKKAKGKQDARTISTGAGFSKGIERLITSDHAACTIETAAKNNLCRKLGKLAIKIARRAAFTAEGRENMTIADIKAAIESFFPRSLKQHALAEGAKMVTLFESGFLFTTATTQTRTKVTRKEIHAEAAPKRGVLKSTTAKKISKGASKTTRAVSTRSKARSISSGRRKTTKTKSTAKTGISTSPTRPRTRSVKKRKASNGSKASRSSSAKRIKSKSAAKRGVSTSRTRTKSKERGVSTGIKARSTSSGRKKTLKKTSSAKRGVSARSTGRKSRRSSSAIGMKRKSPSKRGVSTSQTRTRSVKKPGISTRSKAGRSGAKSKTSQRKSSAKRSASTSRTRSKKRTGSKARSTSSGRRKTLKRKSPARRGVSESPTPTRTRSVKKRGVSTESKARRSSAKRKTSKRKSSAVAKRDVSKSTTTKKREISKSAATKTSAVRPAKKTKATAKKAIRGTTEITGQMTYADVEQAVKCLNERFNQTLSADALKLIEDCLNQLSLKMISEIKKLKCSSIGAREIREAAMIVFTGTLQQLAVARISQAAACNF